MRHFDADATRDGLPFPRLIAALREAFAAGATVPPRHVHELPLPQGGAMASLIMPAWLPGRRYGVKVVNVAAGNAALGLPTVHAAYLLFDAVTGVPLALLDGDQITARRTAAVSALAASLVAAADSRELLVIGAGRVATLLPEAYRCVLPIERVRLWCRRAEAGRALLERWRGQGFADVALVTELPAAVHRADVISCATLAREPLVQGAWLRPGSHLDLIGSFAPDMREADDHCFAGAAIHVDTEEALNKSGDLLGPLSRGVFSRGDVRATLAELCAGSARRRHGREARTVFKSVGTALADLAAAMLVEASG